MQSLIFQNHNSNETKLKNKFFFLKLLYQWENSTCVFIIVQTSIWIVKNKQQFK